MVFGNTNRGTTLIETLVATAFFLVFSVAIYQLYAKVIDLSNNIRMRTIATEITNEQFETIRNLQYYDVGTVGGIPSGIITPVQTVTRNGVSFEIQTTIRNVDHPADGMLGGTPNDLSPADNKLVEVEVVCTSCKTPVSVVYTSWIAPKSLETENGNGALVIKAIDANGLPIVGADVAIINTALTPAVSISDVTDAAGALTIVDAPPSTENYKITVTKDQYSTETSYAPGALGNPNPTKPHLTVAANQVTQSTFAIDQLSTFHITTTDNMCLPIGNINGSFTGTKLIGTVPDVLKHIYTFTTNSSGVSTLSTIEWDTYATTVSGSIYDIVGINPLSPITVPPNTTQNVSIVLRAATPNTVVAAVTDAATGLSLANATVHIAGGAIDRTKTTNIGSVTQTDWSGGSGQDTMLNQTKFSTSDGGIDYSTVPGQLTLLQVGAVYAGSGSLTSSVFDLGAAATFHQLSWVPVNQPSSAGTAAVRFQIATSATNDVDTIWTFKGPDGTAATYYSTNLADIAAFHDGDQYFRYKLFLSSEDVSVTPTINDISFTYTSGCLPPGQVDFGNLPNGTYTITVSKSGYATEIKNITITGDDTASFALTPS